MCSHVIMHRATLHERGRMGGREGASERARDECSELWIGLQIMSVSHALMCCYMIKFAIFKISFSISANVHYF